MITDGEENTLSRGVCAFIPNERHGYVIIDNQTDVELESYDVGILGIKERFI